MSSAHKILNTFRSTELFGMIHNYASIFKKEPKVDFYNSKVDNMLVMAYQLYLSSITPRFIPDRSDQKMLFDKIKTDYDASVEFLEKDKTAGSFIGLDWGKFADQFRGALLKNDHRKTMATYGARNYKTLELSGTGNFVPFFYKKQISDILNILSHLKESYSAPSIHYKGFTEFFYPHFNFEGNTFNINRLTDLEMRLFLQKMSIPVNVVAEIGAGDGKVCREFIENNKDLKYIIFDLPEMLTRSQLFLSGYFAGKKAVGGYSDFLENSGSVAKTLKKFDILCLPCWISGQIDCSVDLWISVHALGEMPIEISTKYMGIINNNSRFFISVSDDVDRVFKYVTISESSKYLKSLSNMELVRSEYPFSSCFPRFKPFYARHLFKQTKAI